MISHPLSRTGMVHYTYTTHRNGGGARSTNCFVTKKSLKKERGERDDERRERIKNRFTQNGDTRK